jgi:hypothetical protein
MRSCKQFKITRFGQKECLIFDEPLMNTRSIENKKLGRLVLVLCDVLKEGRQQDAYSTKRWLGIWRGKPSQAVHPIGP